MIRMLTLVLLALAPVGAQERIPVSAEPATPPPPELDEARLVEWELRDADGRWVLWRRLCYEANEGASNTAWRDWLVSRGEFELLEREALATAGWIGAPASLAAADAPNWLRVAAWQLRSWDSHTWEGAGSALSRVPELYLAWAELYPEVLEVAKARTLYDELAAAHEGRRADVARYSAPVDEEALFAPLIAAPVWTEFGTRLVADPQEHYLHRTLHAIDCLVATSVRDERWRARLLDLTYVRDERVACAAYEAFSHFPPEQIPLAAFARVADDTTCSARIRASALAAASFGSRAPARSLLARVALTPDHPGAQVAAARLGEIGGFVGREALTDLKARLGDEDERTASVGAALSQAVNRYEDAIVDAPQELARADCEELAWLIGNQGSLPTSHVEALREHLERFVNIHDRGHAELVRIASSYEASPSAFPVGLEAHWTARVRELAAEISAR